MNNRLNAKPATLVVLTLVFAAACVSVPFIKPPPLPPTTSPIAERQHFENEFVGFDHPAGMRIFTAGDPAFLTYPESIRLGGELVVGLADPDWIKQGTLYSSIGIFRHPIPPGSNLETIMQTAYQQESLQTEIVESSGPVTISGLAAYQRNYRIAWGPLWYKFRDTWVEKDGQVLRVSIWEESYAIDFQSPADMLATSLIIKDGLPPIEIRPTVIPTRTPTPIPASMLLHFDNELVAFDYLKGMEFHAGDDPAFQYYPDISLGGELVAGLGDPRFFDFGTYFRSIRIIRQSMPPGSNLESIMLSAYRQMEARYPREKGALDATGPVTVAGLPAYQWTYRIYSGEPAYDLRDIWVPYGGSLYILSIWTEYTNPDDFAAFQAGAELFLSSLKFKG